MISSRWKDQQLDHAVDMASVHLKRSALGWDYHRLLRSTEYDTKKSRFLDWKKLVLLFFHVENHQLQHLTGSLCVDSSRFLMRCGPLRPVQLWGKKWLKMISEFDVFWCHEFLCPPVAIGLVSREKARTSSQHPWISLQNQFVEIKSLEISIFFINFHEILSTFFLWRFAFSVAFFGAFCRVENHNLPWSAPLLPPRDLWWRKPSESVTRWVQWKIMENWTIGDLRRMNLRLFRRCKFANPLHVRHG